MAKEKTGLPPAVFFDTGGGDIYAGRSREAVIAVIRADMGESFDEGDIGEVPGSYQMHLSDEHGEPTKELITLEDEYGDDEHAYLICSDNI